MNKDALLQEVADYYATMYTDTGIQPDDLTWEDIQDKLGVKRTAAERTMKALVAAGHFEKLKLKMPGGYYRVVFRKL